MTSVPFEEPRVDTIYTGRMTSWPMVVGTCVAAVVVVVNGSRADGAWTDVTLPLLLVGVGVLLNVLTASSVRATAGPNGFTVRWGILGWPRCTYELDDIAAAAVIDLPWWRVSWGLWWTPRHTSCTVRSGPTVKLTLTNSRTVTITVTDPAGAVAAINHALAHRNRRAL